jgi:DNA invertase Pin-like site-specific DNA recombinase
MKRPPSPERLEHAARLIADGASQREVQRTTGLARETIRKHFPGKGWTFVEGGRFRALTRKEM